MITFCVVIAAKRACLSATYGPNQQPRRFIAPLGSFTDIFIVLPTFPVLCRPHEASPTSGFQWRPLGGGSSCPGRLFAPGMSWLVSGRVFISSRIYSGLFFSSVISLATWIGFVFACSLLGVYFKIIHFSSSYCVHSYLHGSILVFCSFFFQCVWWRLCSF